MDKDNDILTPQDEALDSTAQDASMEQDGELAPVAHSAYKPEAGDAITHHLGGMYQNWFLDYASYVILERAVPDIYDGLKPVQRRILHTMNRMEDGRYNKVANVVGETMKFHPHGNASIKDALVQLGQKDLLVDTQGNWGNILTGDDAAAERYIEARLTKFALETVFSPKVTKWKLSYDGRNKEPITLPIKFPPAADAGRGRHRRGAELEDIAPQLQRAARCLGGLPARRAVRAVSRLPHGRLHRREPLQRRRAGAAW